MTIYSLESLPLLDFLCRVELINKDFGPFLDEGFKVAGETSQVARK